MKKAVRLSIGSILFFAALTTPGVLAQEDLQINPVPSPKFQELYDQIDQNMQAHIAFLQELIQSQQEGEEAVQQLVARRLEEIGCNTEVLKVLPSSIRMD
ncbi:unnamed protein product, partial [marine sediment metagenome]